MARPQTGWRRERRNRWLSRLKILELEVPQVPRRVGRVLDNFGEPHWDRLVLDGPPSPLFVTLPVRPLVAAATRAADAVTGRAGYDAFVGAVLGKRREEWAPLAASMDSKS